MIGRLQPVVVAGLLPALEAEFELVDAAGASRDPRSPGARVAILPRHEVAMIDPRTASIPVVGVSGAGYDVLVIADGNVEHIHNPTPAELRDLIHRLATPSATAD